MGKAIIIKGADFSVNKCATIERDPSEFQNLSYIGATMTAGFANKKYIDLGVKPTIDTKVILDIHGVGGRTNILGCWKTNYTTGTFGFNNDRGQYLYAGFLNQFHGNNDGLLALSDAPHTVILDKTGISVDGVLLKTFSPTGAFPADMPNILLFAFYREGAVKYSGQDAAADIAAYQDYKLEVSRVRVIEDQTTIIDASAKQEIATGLNGLFDATSGLFYVSQTENNFYGVV